MACIAGMEQSPIDLRATAATTQPEILTSYSESAMRVTNNGHTVQWSFDPGSTLAVGGSTYELRQVHFHAPSEHRIEAAGHPIELHLVHADVADNLAVVGVMVDGSGSSDHAGLGTLVANLPVSETLEMAPSGVTFDASDLVPGDLSAYRYDGSLTTPPCREGVKWHVLATPIVASPARVAALEGVYSANNRPVQPLGGRTVTFGP
jgi:carbonic anhydrase